MNIKLLNELKLNILKRIDLLVWRQYHQTLSEVLNDLYIRSLCVKPDMTADEILIALWKNRILLRISGNEAKDLHEAVEKIVKGTYGFCLECKREIDASELERDPVQKTCNECKQKHNQHPMTVIELMKSVSVFEW